MNQVEDRKALGPDERKLRGDDVIRVGDFVWFENSSCYQITWEDRAVFGYTVAQIREKNIFPGMGKTFFCFIPRSLVLHSEPVTQSDLVGSW